MQHRHQNHGIIMTVLYAIFGFLLFVDNCGIEATTWHQGCFNLTMEENETKVQLPSIVACCESCLQQGYTFVGISPTTRCQCLQDISNLTASGDRHCNSSCPLGAPGLPCGGHCVVSVYNTRGPYLLHVRATTDGVVVEGRKTAIQVLVQFASVPTIELGAGAEDATAAEVEFVWSAGEEGSHTECVLADEELVQAAWLTRFKQPGLHTIDIRVSNLLSNVTLQVNVTVVSAVPTDLQLALLTKDDQLPTCVSGQARDDVAIVPVFRGVAVLFEASVATGTNLTFEWTFSDDAAGSQSDEKAWCERRNCSTSTMEHVFAEIGQFNVKVRVANIFDSLETILHVIVLHQNIQQLNFTLHSNSTKVTTPFQPLKFVITMVTASRRDTFLEVSFGDGTVEKYCVKEENGSLIGLENAPGDDYIYLVGNYGEECELILEIDHVYKHEGEYLPSVKGLNAHSNIQKHLVTKLVIQNRLQTVTLIHPHAAALGSPVTFTVNFGTRSVSTHFHWTVEVDGGQQVNFTSNQPVLTHTFSHCGVHQVAVIASNRINSVTVTSSVTVEVPLDGVTLTTPTRSVELGEARGFHAAVTAGSDLGFKWDFDDSGETQIVSGNMTSVASHLFSRAGDYNVSVTVTNMLDSVTVYLPHLVSVQEPVSGLTLTCSSPTLLANATTFVTTVAQGSHLKFQFHFGTEIEKIAMTNNRSVTARHKFPDTGSYEVTVQAFNDVSEESRKVSVIVQAAVPPVSIETTPATVKGEHTPFYALLNGALSPREDIVYRWGMVNETTVYTRVPLMTAVFEDVIPRHVQLTAYNLVSSEESSSDVSVQQTSDDTRFSQSGVCPLQEPTRLHLLSLPKVDMNIHVSYGESSKHTIPHTASSDTLSWDHLYVAARLYQVTATCIPLAGDSVTISSWVSVQQPLTDLSLVGPSAIPAASSGHEFSWTARLVSGTDVLYNWTVDGSSTVTTSDKLSWRFSATGTYALGVTAFNQVSKLMASLEVRVQHPVSFVRLRINPVVQGTQTDISVTLRGSHDFQVNIDFGDNNKTTILSSDTRICKTEMSSAEPNNSVQLKLVVGHTYTESGQFNVTVNVSNLISYKVSSKIALVDEPIEGITMTTEAGPVVTVNKVVVVKATIASGKNLTFEWDFSDSLPSTVISSDNTSMAKHVFHEAGVYPVRLRLINPLYTDPIVAQLPFDLEAIEGVDTLQVSELNRRTAANLTRTPSGNYTTRSIKFVAWAEQGSSVTFTFDFGDGHTQIVGSNFDPLFHNLFGHAIHRYTKVGDYQVSVTAHNPLGNTTVTLPQLFAVQVLPSGLGLKDRLIYHTLLGNSTHFQATITAGTDVQFDWDMGDQTEYVDAGTMLVHRYMAVGAYTITVKAYNKVGSEQVEAKVKVDTIIQEVELTVDKVIHSTGTPVTFTATAFPERHISATSTYYKWEFGEVGKPAIGNFKDVEKHTFRRHGNHTVRVTAKNHFSSVTSEPLEVQSVDALSKLMVFIHGETVVGREIKFEAYVFQGSDIIYYWDFGDNKTFVTKYSKLRYTYRRTGQFQVTVVAVNPLGNKTATQPVFILSKMCKPPDINILGNKGRQVYRTNELKIEAKVAINCSITSLALYKWTFRNGTSREVILEDHNFHDPVLLLPRRKLVYGNYSIELKVEMADTIVYSSAKTYLFVVPNILLAIINGGIQRYVSRQETVIMNGSMSHDPDFAATDDLSFNWTCYVLLSRDMSCFVDNSSTWLDVTNRTLAIPSSHFKPEFVDFVFTLTVSKAGRSSSNITQVLHMEQQEMLDVSVNCPLCEDGLVNADRRLILQAGHHGYKEEELDFEWRLYVIADGSTSVGAHNRASCVEADGSSYQLQTANSSTVQPVLAAGSTTTPATTTTTTTTTIVMTTTARQSTTATTTTEKHSPSTTPRSGSGQPTQPSTTPTTTTRDWFNPGEGEAAAASRSGFSEFGNLDEGNPADSGSARLGSWPFGGTASGGQTAQTVEGATEGRGSGRDQGSGQGRVPPNGGDGAGPGSQGNDGKKVVDPIVPQQSVVRFTPHIVSEVRYSVVLKPSQTTTGLHQRALVIKQGVFKQGRTYIIKLKVKHKVSGLQGKALAYFKVNESPSHGDCTIKPEMGMEMETDFRIFCKAWKDAEMPLSYEVSYNLSDQGSRDLLYQGLNHVIIFQLPAGQPSNSYKVEVHISILDSLGARTSVCSLPIKVTPRPLATGNQTEEDILYSLVREGDSTLHTYVQEGDNRAARLHSQIIATRLNRLDVTSDPAPTEKRQQIRTALLSTLKGLPMRDEYEVQQTASAMRSSTAVTDELTQDSLRYASVILGNLTERMYHISTDTSHLDQSISVAALETTANILTAVSTTVHMSKQQAREVVSTSTRAIEKILQTELSTTVLGEEPFIKTSRKLSVSAGRFKTSVLPPAVIETAHFKLPRNMKGVMTDKVTPVSERQEKVPVDEDCYEAHTVVFADNLYSFGQTNDNSVQTPVASLTLYSCNGQRLKVTNLTGSDQINMSLQNQEELDAGNYSLRKHVMDIHLVNVSQAQRGQYFHLSVQLQPVRSGRLFPVTILLRQDEPPTPTQHWRKWQFGADEDLLQIFLPSHTLNHSSTYYVGIVDSDYNAGRPREGEVRQRDYSMRMWWSECLYWDEAHQQWATDGCSVQPTSSYHTAHCSCSHLTSFGAHFSLMPNHLNFINVEDFFDVNENPVCVALVVTLLAVYFVMLFVCVRHDFHDKKKGSLVHLVDNLAKFQQRYIIMFETGFRKGAGTTAKVSIVLHGEEGMSETRELVSKTGQPLFERNSRDTFIVMLPENLGRIWKVQIWHNNAGLTPSWYLSRVSVLDTVKGNTYYFNCEKWFAVEEEDGKVEREIMAVEGGLGFRKVLWAKGTQYFADLHVWFSTLTRPSYSRFTRAQRLTCCLSLLMSYLAVNAAWYKTSMQEYRGEFGLIDVSWRTVIVGVINSLLVLPVNLLIVLLFRRSKVQRMEEDAVVESYDYSKRESVSSIESKLLQPVLAPSIFDQSILNWQSLQEWAQKTWAKHHQQSVDSSGVQPIYEQKPDDDRLTTGHHNNRDSGLSTDHTEQLDDTSEEPHTESNNHKHDKKALEGDDTSKTSTPCDKILVERLSEKSFYDEGRHSTKPARVFLPCCFAYFGWVLAWVVITGCGVVTILYGFRFGRTKSILWLQSLIFSFIQCVFITHPFLILLLSIYVAVKYKNSMAIFDHYDDGWIMVHRKSKETELSASPTHLSKAEEAELDLTTGVAARQRSRYLRFARPPQEKQLIESRKKIIKEKVASYVLSEGFHIGLQFLLLMLMAFGKDTGTPYLLNSSLSNTFVRSGQLPFSSVASVPDWWKWLHTDFLDTVYWDQWYNGQATTAREKGYIGGSVLIGQVILRQQRMKPQPCDLPYQYMSELCHHNGVNSDTSVGSSHSKKASTVYDNYGYYEGDGYLVVLGHNRSDVYRLLHHLRHGNWVNKYTRQLTLELTLFYAPSNLFSSVKLWLDVPPSCGVSPHYHITATYLYRYMGVLDNIVLACELLFIIVTLLGVRSEVMQAVWQRKLYLKNIWNCVQVTLCTVALSFIACFVYRFILVQEKVEELRATYHSQYVDVSHIAFWDHILRSLIGLLLFLTILQVLKLLCHQRPFVTYSSVLRHAASDIVIFGAVFVIWVCAYLSIGMALYGSVSHNFSSVATALQSITGLLTGHYDFKEMEGTRDFWSLLGWRLFVVSFLLLALGSLTAYIIAALTFHIRVYKHNTKLVLSPLETLRFYWRHLLLLLHIKRTYSDDEDSVVLPPEFVMAEIEYQVDEMLFKMNALAGTSNLPEKPPIYFTDSDGTYGVGEDAISTGSEMQPFDDDRYEHHTHRLPHMHHLHHTGGALFHFDHQLSHLMQHGDLGDISEKQLRSQLEFETLCHLQMVQQQQQPSNMVTYPSSLGYHKALSSSSSNVSASHSSTDAAPASSLTSSDRDSGHASPSPHHRRGPGQDAEREVKREAFQDADRDMREITVNADFQHCHSLSENSRDSIPLEDFTGRNVSWPGCTETRLNHHCSNGSWSGGAEVSSILSQDSVPDKESKPSHRSLAHQSSSSDHESFPHHTKARCLRKTKSRGKGKGCLSPGLDEFGFDNDAYSSDSSCEHGDGTNTHKSAPRECWT